MMVHSRVACAGVAALACWGAAVAVAQRPDAFIASRDHAAIQYSARPVDTTVARLNRELESGRVKLTYDPKSGYLPALLAALNLPVESQLLVFSETSAQASLIKLANPRALFFNDTTAVGWVRGASALEVVAHDPRQGAIFYTLEQKRVERPQLKRDNDCLLCHLTWETLGVPGLTMISTFPMSDDPNAYASGVTVDHRTDLDMRWGGWFVTGRSVPPRHYGNLPVVRPQSELPTAVPRPPLLASVTGKFDVAGFPTPYSDIVASMVLAHQTTMTNQLTRLGWEARVAGERPSKATADRVQQAVNDFVDYLLFIDEAPMTSRVEGSSGFAEKFAALGPNDSRGRSLRQLDLQKRLLRYQCSYMIYSPAFDALPPATLDAVYRRMWTVLSGQERSKPYARLQVADRRATIEILRDTKKNLPSYFQGAIQ